MLDRSLDLELESALDKDDVRAFLWSAFQSNGAMPPPYFVPLLNALCPVHGSGLHPARIGPAGVWFCPAADHAVGPVVAM